MSAELQVPVLVVGGGLTGLAAALFLARQGVKPLVVERHTGLSPHPRARGIHPRAMELVRSAGLEDAVRSTGSARALVHNTGVLAAETLAGKQLGALHEKYFMDVRTELSALSPTGWCLCHQDEFEPVLHEAAAQAGADFRFGTELLSFEQDQDGVTAVLGDREGGNRQSVRASYLLAADGPGSPVRERLGIPFEGEEGLGHFLNVHFRAALAEVLGDRRFIMCYTFNSEVRGALMPLDNASRWLLHVVLQPDENLGDYTDERCARLVRAAAGVPDLDVEIVGTAPWTASAKTAGGFQQGRVFLLGDAAHIMPPSGAFGSNTGLQDAHNLAWKLAAVLRGEAGPALLDSYDAERRPVSAATVEQAALRSKDRPRLAQQEPAPALPGIVDDIRIWFGWHYRSAAVLPDADAVGQDPADPTDPSAVWADDPSGQPGTRAPHVALRRDGNELSTLDLYGKAFVLLTGPEAGQWPEAARTAADALGVPVEVHAVGTGAALLDPEDRWAKAHGVTPAGAVLVRPDGVVAWRSADSRSDAPQAVRTALAHVLSR